MITRFAAETTDAPRSTYMRWRRTVMDREPDTHLPSQVTLGRLAGDWVAVRDRVDARRATGGAAQ